MTSARTIPTPQPADLVTFTVKADGSELPKSLNILSIQISREVNRIPTARIMIADGDASKEDFEVSNLPELTPGKEIEVLAGYHSDESTLFKGVIVKQGLRIRQGIGSQLQLELKDLTTRMTIGRKNAYHSGKDSDIISDLISTYEGLESTIEDTDVEHPELVQFYTTDWDFMLCRAEANAKLVTIDNGALSVKTPTDEDAVLSLVYGATILDFEAETDTRTQYSNIKSFSWDYATQSVLEAEASDAELPQQGDLTKDDLAATNKLDYYGLQHSGQVTDQELKAWADTQALKSALARIRGRVSFQGYNEVKPGQFVELEGLGAHFNGKAFVSGLRHEISGGNWITHLQLGMADDWFAELYQTQHAPAGGLLPAVSGLQIGVVTQLQDDPDGEDRIRVKLPLVDNNADGVWARMASLDAGENRGAFFRPEIDDEVVLGFLNDDPGDPIVLGMLNSSAKPAPYQASDDNQEKGFKTRSGMQVLFHDDDKSITSDTPNGNSIVISDAEAGILIQDENNNKVVMGPDGITIESASDLKLKATGDVTIEGTNISAAANAQFKAEGSAGAEVSTSAVAVIKGSVVQIN